MATPVVPSQFAVSKNKIGHKPTKATFSFDTGHTTFRALIGGMWVSNYQLAQITGKTM